MKEILRIQLRKDSVPAGASDALQRRLLAQDWWAAAFRVGVYLATPREPQTALLLADLAARGAQVAVPVRRRLVYEWAWVDAATRWRTGAHGIREPVLAKPARPEDLRIIVVPGVAFDAQGGRLGHGHGHFDRLLAASGALLVGLCCENRLTEAVPMEAHDVRMDVVATERRLIFAPGAAAKLERLTG
jgi:5-formyltetrahydrofolate cyclo-ligase